MNITKSFYSITPLNEQAYQLDIIFESKGEKKIKQDLHVYAEA